MPTDHVTETCGLVLAHVRAPAPCGVYIPLEYADFSKSGKGRAHWLVTCFFLPTTPQEPGILHMKLPTLSIYYLPNFIYGHNNTGSVVALVTLLYTNPST
jgi:hypothetical protein